MPQYDGLWDHYGRVRPAYFAFKLLSLVRGRNIPVRGAPQDLHALAGKDERGLNLVLWNYPDAGPGVSRQVTLRFPATQAGQFREIHLNADAPRNELELHRQGSVTDLAQDPVRLTLKPYGICWITIGP